MSNQRGFSTILIIIIVVILGIGAYLYLASSDEEMTMMDKASDFMMNKGTGDFGAMDDFEEMEEPEGTPPELSNETIAELDKLMLEIDANVSGEDLSDL